MRPPAAFAVEIVQPRGQFLVPLLQLFDVADIFDLLDALRCSDLAFEFAGAPFQLGQSLFRRRVVAGLSRWQVRVEQLTNLRCQAEAATAVFQAWKA